MEKKIVKKWPAVSASVFEDDSSEETVQAFRNDPFLGVHKHGPNCIGDVRAIVFPLSREARVSCEAEPKGQDETSLIVELRLCDESTFFTIGTSLTSNVTLRYTEDDIEDDNRDVPGWIHQIEARIYPDPDSDDAELFNGSYDSIITLASDDGRHTYHVSPGKCLRLSARRTWIVRMTDLHTFGLVLQPCLDLYGALQEELMREHQPTRRSPVSKNTAKNEHISPVAQSTAQQIKEARLINLSMLLRIARKPFEACEFVDANLQPLTDDGRQTAEIMENRVEVIMLGNKKRARKTLRRPNLYTAAMIWEKERDTHVILDHPNITKALEWDIRNLTIDFEYGGRDLASLRSAANMFTVARDLAVIQKRILLHTISALEYLHEEKRIKHLDIKPQNILLSEDHMTIKICDLGLAADERAVVSGGTHQYIAPEILFDGISGTASDIWALGVTMLFVLNMVPLPGTEHGAEYWEIHKLGTDQSERRKLRNWHRTISAAVERVPRKWSFLKEMLSHDPESRITAKELKQRLEQPAMILEWGTGALLEA